MKNLQNISPEIDHHSKEGSQVKHDIEEDWGFLHSKEGLEENEMTGTTDGKEFCYSLNNTEEDSLKEINLRTPLKF